MQTTSRPGASVSVSVVVTLVVGAVAAFSLLAAGSRPYPNLHTVLDTSACLLSGVLALLLWDIGRRSPLALPRWLSLCFAASFVAELLHVSTVFQWFGVLAGLATSQQLLRPTSWPLAAHILVLGVLASLWLTHDRQRPIWPLIVALPVAGVLLFLLFLELPRFTKPGWLGITRPWLIAVPPLWAGVAWICWRRRARGRLYPMLALTAAVLTVAHLGIMFAPVVGATQSMVSHIGKISAYLALILMLMRAATADMFEKVKAEGDLARLNADLELIVRARTGELQSAYDATHAIIDTALDGVIVMDSTGAIREFNEAAQRIFGHPREAVIGRTVAEVIIPPELREAHAIALAHYLGTGEARILGRRIEVDGLRGDGTSIPLELTVNRVPGEGAPVFAAFIRDLTPRRLAETRLATQLSRLDLLNHISHAIGERQDLRSILQVALRSLEEDAAIDFGCVCLYDATSASLTVCAVGPRSSSKASQLGLNPNARVILDRECLERAVGGTLIYEADTAASDHPFLLGLAQGGLLSLVVAPLQAESRVFGVLLAARGQPDAFGSADCEFLRQLSEHVALAANQAETHEALQRAYDDLRQTQQAVMQQERLRALGQMASGIAHDINNAISPIALYAEALLERERTLSESGREYLKVIQRAMEDVVQTVARMREFYRASPPTLELKPVKLNDLVQQVVELTRARWSGIPQQRGIVITPRTELAHDLPTVMGVESEIREALLNLVFNGVDAMPQGGTLTLSTGVDARQGEVFVQVQDTGVGMDEETRRRCLEPFFTTKGERGTGLGLAMVYGIVQRHGAEIRIDSAVGQGTAMRLAFPRRAAAAEGTPQAALPSAPIVGRQRLLVVDDDPLLLRSLRDILEADGHQVTTASAGQDGVDAFSAALARREAFTVVLTDLGMPHMDGRRVARAIKALSPSTPVILLTGWGQRLLDEGDIPEHVDLVLSKPPKVRTLREALAKCTQST